MKEHLNKKCKKFDLMPRHVIFGEIWPDSIKLMAQTIRQINDPDNSNDDLTSTNQGRKKATDYFEQGVTLHCHSKVRGNLYFYSKMTIKTFVYWAANQHIRMISERSRDTEDWSNDAENSALHHRNKLHF